MAPQDGKQTKAKTSICIQPHQKYPRLPNVVPLARPADDETADLAALIRRIVREEIQRLVKTESAKKPTVQSTETQTISRDATEKPECAKMPTVQSTETQTISRDSTEMSQPHCEEQQGSTRSIRQGLDAIEAIVSEKAEDPPAPISTSRPSSAGQRCPPKKPLHPTVHAARTAEVAAEPRKTDLWRTADNSPLCFHCGRPGHVVRYCRERRAVFNELRLNKTRDASPFSRLRSSMQIQAATKISDSSHAQDRRDLHMDSFPSSASDFRRHTADPVRRLADEMMKTKECCLVGCRRCRCFCCRSF